ncbi:hypothetical protein [Thermococcus sp.]
MKWLRAEKGYPDDYPDKEIVEAAKVILRMRNARPPELAKMEIVTPEESVKPEDIPPAWVFRALRESAENIRDEAFFAVAEEWGPRIGGIGRLLVKQVKFDDFGAWIYPEDKTHRGRTRQARMVSQVSEALAGRASFCQQSGRPTMG